MSIKISSKEYDDMDISDHVEGQGVLDMLEKHNCLSEKGKVYKHRYFEELDKDGYLDEEFKSSQIIKKTPEGKE